LEPCKRNPELPEHRHYRKDGQLWCEGYEIDNITLPEPKETKMCLKIAVLKGLRVIPANVDIVEIPENMTNDGEIAELIYERYHRDLDRKDEFSVNWDSEKGHGTITVDFFTTWATMTKVSTEEPAKK